MVLALLIVLATTAQHAQHHDHARQVDARGDQVMGFSHEKTKHTFRLIADGGAIEVRALDADDAESIGAIRSHLKVIEKEFAGGTFSKPDAVHGTIPDGADVMKELRADIEYRFEEIPAGARVRITTSNERALEAVHRFLKFQIEDHRTGDSTDVEPSA